MSFLEFYNATSGLGDAFVDARNQREAQKLYGQQLDTALAAQGQQPLSALGSSVSTAAPQSLGALGAPVSRALPTFASLDGAAPSAKIAGLIAETTAKNNLDPEYLPKLVQVESGGNPNAYNKGSGASGLGQFIPSTARAYGLSNPFDPAANLDATARLTADNRKVLAQALGREPTNGELYLGHQQGAGGAAKLLANPNARAADIVGVRAVVSNGGRPDMTAGEFASKWTSKFGGGGQARQVASADPEADVPAAGSVPVGFQPPAGQSQEFQPGTVASPAVADPRGAGAGVGLTTAAAPRITPAQAQNLRSMLANPLTQGHAAKIIEGLNKPDEFSFQVVGDQLVRTSKTGRAEVVPNITKPPEFQTVKGSDGNDYTFNRATGQWTRAIQGKSTEFMDLVTPQERLAAGIQPSYTGPAQRGPDGEIKLPGKASTEVNVDNRGETAFASAAQGGIAKRFLALSEEGDAARSEGALLGQLRGLGDVVGTGALAATRSWLADKGIKLGDNIGAVEAYGSLVDKLVPAQRVPGSGTTSDFDAKGFKASLPRLMNTPEGNSLIIGTLEALNDWKVQRAAIAEKGLTGELKPGEAIRQLSALPSPNTAFRSGLSELQKAGKLGAEPAARARGGASKPGVLDVGGSTVIDGVTIKRIN